MDVSLILKRAVFSMGAVADFHPTAKDTPKSLVPHQ